ncbi:MAG: 4-(cytidine 5'-diphospho)-2-C-methyl-D-erythritol kinase [Candidatus Aminicenantaceae bacterium]
MRVKAFAKINLGLEIVKKREDNFHEIRTLFQTIELYDILEFKSREDGKISLRGNDESVPWDEDNLIFKAVLLLKKQFGLSQGVEILVTKNIPPGKGLGGGSSDAAMTLYALNKIWGLRLGMIDLMELGKIIGADVPYFLTGGLCLGLERGDEIVPLPDLVPLYCLLVFPSFTISTSLIYGQFQFPLTSEGKDSKINWFLKTRDFSLLENRLEETIFSLHPQLRAIKSLFQSLGSDVSLVSGTGSAVFGIFKDRAKAYRGLGELKKKYLALCVETISRERYWNRLSVGV